LLVAVAIALPVAVGTAWSVVSSTAQPTVDEQLSAFWGTADARLQTEPGADGVVAFVSPLEADARLAQVLAPGTARAVDIDVPLVVATSAGRTVEVQGRVLDLGNPLAAGLYRIDEGAPSGAGAQLSDALARKLQVGVGSEILVAGQPVTIDALLAYRDDLKRDVLVLAPALVQPGGVLDGVLDTNDAGSARWLLRVAPGDVDEVRARVAPLDLSMIDRADAVRRLEPPALIDTGAVTVSALLLVEAALMAIAAFTVVVATQCRNVGLLAAVGAPAFVRRRVVIDYAVLVAAGGAVVGVVLGQCAAAVLLPILQRNAAQDWGPFAPAPVGVALVSGVAVLAAVGAAVAPARAASRTPVLELLRGAVRHPVATPSRVRWFRWLPPVLVTTIVLVLAAATADPLPLAAGVVAAVALLAAVVSSAVLAYARPLRSLRRPQVRLVLRVLCAVPARLTALLTAAALVVALGGTVLMVTAAVQENRLGATPPIPLGSALLTLSGALTARESDVVQSNSLRRVASFATAAVLDTASDGGPLRTFSLSPATPMLRCVERGGQLLGTVNVTPCLQQHPGSTPFPSVGIADADAIGEITGTPLSTRARAVLTEGGAVVVDGVTESPEEPVELVRGPSSREDSSRFVSIATVPVSEHVPAPPYSNLPAVYLAPETATRLGLAVLDGRVFVPPTVPTVAVGTDEIERLTASLPARYQADVDSVVQPVEIEGAAAARAVTIIGAVTTITVAATVLGAGTALWNAESRPELSRLAVIGARRRWLVTYGAIFGGVMAVLVAVVAAVPVALGSLLFLGIVGLPPVVPVVALTALLVGTVVVSAAAGALVVPRRGLLIRPTS